MEPEAPIPEQAETGSRKKGGGIPTLERLARIDFAADALLTFPRASDQIDAVCKKFGIEWRQANRYLSLARDRIIAATAKPKDLWLAESVELYDSISRNRYEKTRDRIAARKQLDRAVGIGIATKVEISATPDALAVIDTASIAQAAREERAKRAEPEEVPA